MHPHPYLSHCGSDCGPRAFPAGYVGHSGATLKENLIQQFGTEKLGQYNLKLAQQSTCITSPAYQSYICGGKEGCDRIGFPLSDGGDAASARCHLSAGSEGWVPGKKTLPWWQFSAEYQCQQATKTVVLVS